MEQSIVETKDAPGAIGPYVQARKVGPFLFTSGQVGFVPETGEFAGDDVVAQTKQVLRNLAAVVRAAGGDLTHIVKTMVFVKDMNDFAVVNGVYAEFFGDHKPARSCVEAARLPKDALVEIECVAYIG